jgi:hypothetical protein
MTEQTKPQLTLSKALDETSIRQFYRSIVGRDLTDEELAELHEECEKAGLPAKSDSPSS